MSGEGRGRGRGGRGRGRGEPVGTRGTSSIGQPSPNSPTDASTTITTNNMFSFPQNSQAQQYIAPSPITAIRFDDPTFSLEDDETFQQGLEIPAVSSPTHSNYQTLFQYSSQFPIARYPSPQSTGYNAFSSSQLPQYQPLQSTPFTFQTLLQSYQAEDLSDEQEATSFNPSSYSSAFANYGSSQINNSYPKQQQPANVQPIQPPSYTPFQRQQYQPGQPYQPSVNPANTGYAPYQTNMGIPNSQPFIPAQMQQMQYQFQQMQLSSGYMQPQQVQPGTQATQKYGQNYQHGQASSTLVKGPPPSGQPSKTPVWGTPMKFSVPPGGEHDNNNIVPSNNNHISDDFQGNNNIPVSVSASTPVPGSSPTNNAISSNNNLSSKNNNNAISSNNMVSSALLALTDSPANLAKKPVITMKRAGKPVPIATNHFEFRVKEQTIYQYAVEFVPDIESRRKRMKLLETQKELIGESYIFDGSMLFLQKVIGEISVEVDMQQFNEGSPEEAPGSPSKQRLVITPTTQIKPGDHAPLQLYNMIFRKILRILKLKQIGRHYYDPHRPISIPQHRVELWPGYFTSVNPSEKGTVLIADVTHKVLRTDTVLDLLHEISANNGRNWREAAIKQLIGQVVLTRYNNRTYRIDEIAWDMTPLSTFVKKNGEKTSYQKYYSITYNKSLTETNQPLLVHKHKRRGHDDETIYLIPELCCMTGISDSMRADFQVMRDISEHTRVFPNRRGEELTRFLKHINEQEEVKQELDNWWLQLDPEMLITEGRVFNAEKVIFSKKAQVIDPKTGEWSGLCKNSELLTPVHIANWMLIYIGKNDKLAQDFCNNLIRVADSVGLRIEKPLMIQLNDDKKQTFIDAIKNNMRDKVQCVVCVLPSANKDRYDAIKKVCSVEISVPSQCVIAKSLSKPKTLLSVCNKIALQMNCKLGGELWKLEIPLSKTMLVGIDVCHDTSRGGRQSVAGFCASMNSSFTKYYSRVTFQKSGQELVDGLKVCMTEAVRQFFELNKFPPEIIIVFRDGVGDGMLEALVDHEIPQMKDTFKAFGDNYRPKLAVIVVKKRIHTRLFFRADSLMNPGPGTVVDSVCTHRSWYDFFLVSQSVRQGTVTPTHYHVVYDTTGIQPDHIQMLTYKMCHLYYNWPGTIRVPAPCQYAHKIAFLVGQSLHIDPSPKLTHKLHYL